MIDFLNFIKKTRVAKDTKLVSIDVTGPYTNIPQKEGVTIVCNTHETFHLNKPLMIILYLRDMLRLIFQENSFHFGRTHIEQLSWKSYIDDVSRK